MTFVHNKNRDEALSFELPVIEVTKNNNLLKLDKGEILSAFGRSGLILIRGNGFDIQDLEKFSQRLCSEFHNVGARHKMRKKHGDGYSTEVFRENFALLAHTEGTFRPLLDYSNGVYKIHSTPPDVCFFMCFVSPVERGGETTLVDGVKFIDLLPQNLRSRFEKEGIAYSMSWEPDRWKNEFLVDSAGLLTELLSGISGVKHSFHDDVLELYYKTRAVTKTRSGDYAFATGMLAHLPRITHPAYQEKKVHAKPTNRVYFGDGEELSDEIINELIDIHDTLVYPHRWQVGDVLMIDNTRFMHGRTMTARPCERVIASRFGWLKSAE